MPSTPPADAGLRQTIVAAPRARNYNVGLASTANRCLLHGNGQKQRYQRPLRRWARRRELHFCGVIFENVSEITRHCPAFLTAIQVNLAVWSVVVLITRAASP